jgi:hypothetical protein
MQFFFDQIRVIAQRSVIVSITLVDEAMNRLGQLHYEFSPDEAQQFLAGALTSAGEIVTRELERRAAVHADPAALQMRIAEAARLRQEAAEAETRRDLAAAEEASLRKAIADKRAALSALAELERAAIAARARAHPEPTATPATPAEGAAK